MTNNGVLWSRLSEARDAGNEAENDLQKVTKLSQAQGVAMETLQEEMKEQSETNTKLQSWKRGKGKRLKELEERMKYLNKIGTLDADKLANDNKKLEALVRNLNKELVALKNGDNALSENKKLKKEVVELKKKLAKERQVKQMAIENINAFRDGNQTFYDSWDELIDSQEGKLCGVFDESSMMSSRGMEDSQLLPPKFSLVAGDRIQSNPSTGVTGFTPRNVKVTLDARADEDDILMTTARKMNRIIPTGEADARPTPRRTPSLYDSRSVFASRQSRVVTSYESGFGRTSLFPPGGFPQLSSQDTVGNVVSPTIPEGRPSGGPRTTPLVRPRGVTRLSNPRRLDSTF